jgi:hypothetical protein
MVLAYFFAQLLLWAEGRRYSLLVFYSLSLSPLLRAAIDDDLFIFIFSVICE